MGVAVTAPTGIAALNIGGTTVHRWCGMQLGPQDGEDFLQAAERLEEQPSIHGARKRVRATEVLVVDEIQTGFARTGEMFAVEQVNASLSVTFCCTWKSCIQKPWKQFCLSYPNSVVGMTC